MKIEWGDWLTKEEYENRSIKKGDVVELNEDESCRGRYVIGYSTYITVVGRDYGSSDNLITSEDGVEIFLPQTVNGEFDIPRVRIGKVALDESYPVGSEINNAVVDNEDGDTLEFNTLIKSNYGWVGVEKNSGNVVAEIEDSSIRSFKLCDIKEII